MWAACVWQREGKSFYIGYVYMHQRHERRDVQKVWRQEQTIGGRGPT